MTDKTQASVVNTQITTLSTCVGRMQAGSVFTPTPAELTDLGNLAGNLNAAMAEQYPPGQPPVPPTDPTDPFAAYHVRLAGGQWRAYAAAFFTESNALIAAYPEQQPAIAQILALYGPGGGGNVMGETDGNNNYWFYKWVDGNATKTPDVNGAADAYVQQLAGPAYRTLYL